MILPRIQYAIPKVLEKRLEIIDAIRHLASDDKTGELLGQVGPRTLGGLNLRLGKSVFGKAAADDPVHPGWPGGTSGGRGGQFRPKDSSGRDAASRTQGAVVTVHPCGTAFGLCLGSFGDDPRCSHALAACRNTGLPTIFPGGFVGRR